MTHRSKLLNQHRLAQKMVGHENALRIRGGPHHCFRDFLVMSELPECSSRPPERVNANLAEGVVPLGTRGEV